MAEGGALLRHCAGNCTEGSNPSLSAILTFSVIPFLHYRLNTPIGPACRATSNGKLSGVLFLLAVVMFQNSTETLFALNTALGGRCEIDIGNIVVDVGDIVAMSENMIPFSSLPS